MPQDLTRFKAGMAGTRYELVKQPNDAFPVTIDFADWLAVVNPDALVASGTAAVLPIDDVPTLSAVSVVEDGKALRFIVSAGGAGFLGTITVLGTFDDSTKKEVEIDIIIRETEYTAP